MGDNNTVYAVSDLDLLKADERGVKLKNEYIVYYSDCALKPTINGMNSVGERDILKLEITFYSRPSITLKCVHGFDLNRPKSFYVSKRKARLRFIDFNGAIRRYGYTTLDLT